MTFEITGKPMFTTGPCDKYSKYVKLVRNRIVEAEFYWFQVNPRKSYRLRINEQKFIEAQKHMRSKKLMNIQFEKFTDLITPIFVFEVAHVSSFALRSTFDHLFDQNSNGTIEEEELQSLFILLQGINSEKQVQLHENLRHKLGSKKRRITFTEFCEFVQSGYLRELLMG